MAVVSRIQTPRLHPSGLPESPVLEGPGNPIAELTRPEQPFGMFVGNILTWRPTFNIFLVRPDPPHYVVLQEDISRMLWTALQIIHTQLSVNDAIADAAQAVGIRPPPAWLRNPLHEAFNPLNCCFPTVDDAMAVFQGLQAAGSQAIRWAGEFVRGVYRIRTGLTGTPRIDRPLLKYLRSIGWPGHYDPSGSRLQLDSNTGRVILHPSRFNTERSVILSPRNAEAPTDSAIVPPGHGRPRGRCHSCRVNHHEDTSCAPFSPSEMDTESGGSTSPNGPTVILSPDSEYHPDSPRRFTWSQLEQDIFGSDNDTDVGNRITEDEAGIADEDDLVLVEKGGVQGGIHDTN
ncbi:uncharacterized protein C8Q71DRAFT_727395 [Rhodofomes roseus]|uniref:Uncharacterized protein n=1 Tax=Rhodofomes roseus TaxID=34475 RepID=A0ABQ8K2D8_9APHY|nr:uncharacterized protein C8Q71DRAFT_727395 [Rhodofomes roseus]KAH9830658.1 hypothetical protein C8Q71DRAFT_727395 [Rhodofomes roseus]